MATRQPLRGGPEKLYDVILNFNKGIDKKTADDVSLDSSFKSLINFYNAAEGYLSKRPGVYNSNITEFIRKIVETDYESSNFEVIANKFNESASDVVTRLTDFYNMLLMGEEKTDTQFAFKVDKIIGFQMLKNSYFFDMLKEIDKVFEGEQLEDINSSIYELSCILVGGGYYRPSNGTDKKPGICVTRLSFKLKYTHNKYDLQIECDSVDPTMNPYDDNGTYKCRWDYFPDGYKEGDEGKIPAMSIDISNYNGYSYIATGSNYICKIDQDPDERTSSETYTGESKIIVQIGGYGQTNLYKPTAIELNQIGFNILHSDPLTFYDATGTASKIKGVFYSITQEKDGQQYQQPVNSIPYNKPFQIHIIYTGAATNIEKPKYRPNNGEVDVEKNPYTELPGDWIDSSTKTVYSCNTGINSDQSFELYIKNTASDEFRSYFDTKAVQEDINTGSIKEISELVFSSTHSKVINNQLVLFGGHGYVFFSEYDMFNYFPNYYYIYVASEAGEEAVTGITYFRQYYAIFTNKRIKRMTGGFGSSDFGVYPLSDYIGCPNGRTIRSVGNNLLFLGSDGIYKLKQGYLGEGTENVEKIDEILDGDLNLNNVVQAFVMNNNYIVVKNDGKTWVVYNTTTEAFYEYNLESATGVVYNGRVVDEELMSKTLPFYTIFPPGLYDEHGEFLFVPMYNYLYSDDYESYTRNGMDLLIFRFSDLDFLEEAEKHKDSEGFISSLETHFMNMGFPMHTKKFKELFIKTINKSGHPIPLYVTIVVDDVTVITPKDYIIYYNEANDTFYYIEKIEANTQIDISKALGEFVLGYDRLGNKTVQQLRFKIRKKGRAIKIRISDGYNDYTNLLTEDVNPVKGIPVRKRNDYDFSISSMGIIYKLKKVKEE